jgi:hypothetical protein
MSANTNARSSRDGSCRVLDASACTRKRAGDSNCCSRVLVRPNAVLAAVPTAITKALAH